MAEYFVLFISNSFCIFSSLNIGSVHFQARYLWKFSAPVSLSLSFLKLLWQRRTKPCLFLGWYLANAKSLTTNLTTSQTGLLSQACVCGVGQCLSNCWIMLWFVWIFRFTILSIPSTSRNVFFQPKMKQLCRRKIPRMRLMKKWPPLYRYLYR